MYPHDMQPRQHIDMPSKNLPTFISKVFELAAQMAMQTDWHRLQDESYKLPTSTIQWVLKNDL